MMQQPRTASTASPLTTAAQDSVQPGGAPRIRAGSVVRPDTVRVADVFTYTVTVELPRDARIEWPSISDTTAAVSQRATVSVNDDATGSIRRETATYSLAAWDTGSVPLGLPDAVVRQGDYTVRIPLGAQVYVRSVLPGDTTQHVPKPARDASSLQDIYGQIDALERSVVQARAFVQYTERYRWPLSLALFALLLELWLLSRRGTLP